MISSSDRKIYIFLSLGLVVGISWILFQYNHWGMATPPGSACLFHRVTSLPCPSCGTTRAVAAFLHGDIAGSIFINPAGLLVLVMMAGLTILLILDIFTAGRRVPAAYRHAEQVIRKKPVALILIFLILANWCWNIIKEL